ncbi:pre-mRNA-processing protein 40C [Cucurbita maxima]|uniref:Pre-mRNA-processing protein 40C n=1 Tax=Cucurbita maxima TaxID=3661 RepID=A0A6J1JUS6_CUCMA|nr:pre-mRNA-processing protein 40C [Cucurbita maxima]XP_022992105.1 pre-mRNA-processing protein 40C [Cucurbita maxima]XP_022992106.1 pre-mRNA-processing protein 40C [Cucurbita maxima]XP_022992107.1 pre-mRNA-processing protein 40C [Cucurbita maxima]
MSSASTVSQSMSLPAPPTSNSAANGSSIPNLIPATLPVPPAQSFHIHQLAPGTPMVPGPPGMSPSMPVMFPPSDSSASSTIPGPNMHAAPNSINTSVRPQICGSYPSLAPVVSPPHAIWFQPPQLGGMPRPPFLPYPASYHGPLPFPARGMHLPSVPLPDPQPPGVTPVQVSSATAVPSTHGSHLTGNSLIQTDFNHPELDAHKHAQGMGQSESISLSKHSENWTAHKTESGIMYYYNALTGESTYEKPSGFKGEPDNLMVQPTSVSMSNLSGTDWVLVTMGDGKKYYYNNKTKISSWQIPNEVTELRQQNDEKTKEHSAPLPNNHALTEPGSSPISMNTPAINTGGREAMPLRTVGVSGPSSALDLIKKKLQESGTPVASSPISAPTIAQSDVNLPRDADAAVKALQTENSKVKPKDANGDGNVSDSSSDSEDVDSGPTNEQLIIQFKEMLKERGVAPFSKWDKELPKIVFDPRFKAIPSYSARRSLFEHFVKTRAEEERKEKRAAQKAAIEGFKQLLDSASEDIDHTTSYQTFKKKWGNDPRFEALDRKDRENLLSERVLCLKKAAVEKAQALWAASTTSFKSMLQERGDINVNSRWLRVKDSLRDDPRYRSVKHEDREMLFNEYISELKAVEEEKQRESKAKKEEQEKLKEREREWRKRKEREEQEMERVRLKVRKKEAVASFQALLVESIKDPQASWSESKVKLEKDPQGRASNPDLDSSDTEKLFREHVKMLQERCANEFRTLLSEAFTAEVVSQASEDGKTVLNSWTMAKRTLKPDPRYSKLPRKEREALWRRYADDTLRKQKSANDHKVEKHSNSKSRSTNVAGKLPSKPRIHE